MQGMPPEKKVRLAFLEWLALQISHPRPGGCSHSPEEGLVSEALGGTRICNDRQGATTVDRLGLEEEEQDSSGTG